MEPYGNKWIGDVLAGNAISRAKRTINMTFPFHMKHEKYTEHGNEHNGTYDEYRG
jgi:hypothetical protein